MKVSDFWFVGLTEFFDASACALQYQMVGVICKKLEIPKSNTETYRKNDVLLSLSNKTLHYLKKVTTADQVIYDEARERFFADMKRLKSEIGIDFLAI